MLQIVNPVPGSSSPASSGPASSGGSSSSSSCAPDFFQAAVGSCRVHVFQAGCGGPEDISVPCFWAQNSLQEPNKQHNPEYLPCMERGQEYDLEHANEKSLGAQIYWFKVSTYVDQIAQPYAQICPMLWQPELAALTFLPAGWRMLVFRVQLMRTSLSCSLLRLSWRLIVCSASRTGKSVLT